MRNLDMKIRPYAPSDENDVVQLWIDCGLVVPHNNPSRDIERKMRVNSEWFLVGELEGQVVASCMVGYEGRRGWINYLAVSPSFQRRGYARAIMERAEAILSEAGCPKINLQVRSANARVIEFYKRIGYTKDDVLSMGKRLEPDAPYQGSPVTQPTRQDKVRAYYAAFDEWGRLDSPEGAIEFRRTLEVLKEHLTPGSRVLDLGGGPGRYAAELARRGHRVVLADIAPALLAVARKRFTECGVMAGIESIDEVNAVDLGRYGDESFDAVLALGPFYHLVLEEERRRAAHEIHRVLRPSGVAFVAFIPRTSGVRGLIERAAARPEQAPPEVLRTAADTGVFLNASDTGFQEGYYALPGEIEGLFSSSGFDVLDVLSLKSVAHGLAECLARLDLPLRAEVTRIAAGMSRQPEIVAAGGHALLVARRAARPV